MSLKRHQHEETNEQWLEPAQKRIRSSGGLSDPTTKSQDPQHFHENGFDSISDSERQGAEERHEQSRTIASTAKLTSRAVAPFLTRHIPNQYAPLGSTKDGSTNAPKDPNSKFCYRHRPDMLCRRQADEPSMDKLQNVSLILIMIATLRLTSVSGLRVTLT